MLSADLELHPSTLLVTHRHPKSSGRVHIRQFNRRSWQLGMPEPGYSKPTFYLRNLGATPGLSFWLGSAQYLWTLELNFTFATSTSQTVPSVEFYVGILMQDPKLHFTHTHGPLHVLLCLYLHLGEESYFSHRYEYY